MPAQKWRAHIAAWIGALALCAVVVAGVQKTIAGSEGFYVAKQRAASELVAGSRACQTFVAEYPGLSSVRVRLADFGRKNRGTLVWQLFSDSGERLASDLLDVSGIEDGAYVPFSFPPLRDSEGQELRFCLEMPLGEEGNAVAPWGATSDAYAHGEAVLEGLERKGIDDLVFLLDYRFRFPGTLTAAARRLAVNKPSLWGRSALYVGLAAVYLALAYAFLFKLAGFEQKT